ncbi:MAG: creatininase family protein [Ruminococcaceae bacterium]|nr:creatininase family protein [Oscillospiraceae bacterium]
MISYYNTINDINTDTVIIPVGSIEQHGSHLPTGTDYFIIKKLSEEVAKKIDAYLLPPLPISTCYEHLGTKGCARMRPSTFQAMLTDIILDLKDQGFKKVIVMIGHGGIFIAGPTIREINALYDDIEVIKVETLVNEKIRAVFDGSPLNEIHGGESETSLMLAIEEETVKKDEMVKNDFIPNCPREYLNYAPLPKLSPTGIWGLPSHSTKEKGEKLIELKVEEALRIIEDAFKYTSSDKW